MDFVVCAGVFQHITALPVICSYVREGLRVARPGGLVLFQFEGTRTSEVGLGQVGARITASALDRALTDDLFRIREISSDSRDPVRNVVCVVERTEEQRRPLRHLSNDRAALAARCVRGRCDRYRDA